MLLCVAASCVFWKQNFGFEGIGDHILLRVVKVDVNHNVSFMLNVGGVVLMICCRSILLGVGVVR